MGFVALIGNKIGGLFLQPDYHGKKLGKLMVDKAQELHGDIEVEVFEENSIGRDSYERCGFKLIDKRIHEQTSEQILRLRFAASK